MPTSSRGIKTHINAAALLLTALGPTPFSPAPHSHPVESVFLRVESQKHYIVSHSTDNKPKKHTFWPLFLFILALLKKKIKLKINQ